MIVTDRRRSGGHRRALATLGAAACIAAVLTDGSAASADASALADGVQNPGEAP